MLVKGRPFIKALKFFKSIVSACFGVNFDPQYEELIFAFNKAYLDLGISVTPKVQKYQ